MSRHSIALEEIGYSPNAEGIPYSQAFGDVYHSANGGPDQARHVFLSGNGLPWRWRGQEVFTILETGFGLGLNFLETWRALDDDPRGPARLHFISVEKHPLTQVGLLKAHAQWPGHAARTRELLQSWPLPIEGFHRLHLAGGRITLTLLLGDAPVLLPQLAARVDAFFLDGFAPAKNPEMWSAGIFVQLARLAAHGSTLATWTVAGTVRDKLTEAGFSVEKRAGFGSKREMLSGRLARPEQTAATAVPSPRRAIVIGAGLAGASCAERLAARGWTVEVIERHAAPALEASGNPAGLATPLVNLADEANARLSRAAFLYALRHIAGLREQAGLMQQQGVLRIARDERDAQRFAVLLRELGYPEQLAVFADREAAAHLAQRKVALAGMWFPTGISVDPGAVCAASLAQHAGRVTCRFGVTAGRIEAGTDEWRVHDEHGACIATAPIVIVAGAMATSGLVRTNTLRLETVRGQVTLFTPAAGQSLAIAVTGESHVIPMPDARLMIGATFQAGDTDATPRVADHAANIARVEAMLPGLCAGVAPGSAAGRVGFRTVTPDRLPVFGPVRDEAPGLHVATGLGARGLVWAPLCAELLASQISGEPWPMALELAAAVAPERFRR